jgi:hypothetical protein
MLELPVEQLVICLIAQQQEIYYYKYEGIFLRKSILKRDRNKTI